MTHRHDHGKDIKKPVTPDIQAIREKGGADGDRLATDKLSLEDIVHLTNKVGLAYAAAKKEADRLELLKPTERARIMIKLDDGELSETKLKRLTETHVEYVEFLERLAQAWGDTERLRIRYESYKNLFEARRSLMSYQKAEMKLL